MDNLQPQFEKFLNDVENRLGEIGISLSDCVVDHVCYRVNTTERFNSFAEYFKSQSWLYTKRLYHERNFYYFFLKKPFTFKSFAIHSLEFSEPGGSDAYDEGFQHIELLTKLSFESLTQNPEKVNQLLFSSKHGDEQYLKWSDRIAVKITTTPLFVKSLSENSEAIVNP